MAYPNPTLESAIAEENSVRIPEKTIDREKVCPLLLRVFINMGRHNIMSDYARGSTPANELQIYTWMDATLKELSGLVKEVNPDARRKGTFFDFATVYPDVRTPTYRLREIGTTCSGHRGADDVVSLSSKRFQIGDYLDIAITPPSGRPGPMAPSYGPPGRGRMRPY